jgi:hypothetical protein
MVLNDTNQSSVIIAETPPYFFIIIGILMSGICIQLFNTVKSHKIDYPGEQFLNTYFIAAIVFFLSGSIVTFFDIWIIKSQDVIFFVVNSLIAAGFLCLFLACILFCYHQMKKRIMGNLK